MCEDVLQLLSTTVKNMDVVSWRCCYLSDYLLHAGLRSLRIDPGHYFQAVHLKAKMKFDWLLRLIDFKENSNLAQHTALTLCLAFTEQDHADSLFYLTGYNVLMCGFLCMYFYLLPNGVINK